MFFSIFTYGQKITKKNSIKQKSRNFSGIFNGIVMSYFEKCRLRNSLVGKIWPRCDRWSWQRNDGHLSWQRFIAWSTYDKHIFHDSCQDHSMIIIFSNFFHNFIKQRKWLFSAIWWQVQLIMWHIWLASVLISPQ